MIKYLFPLKWPSNVPVIPLMKQRNDSGFSPNISLTDAVRFLEEEVDLAGIKLATLYTDYEQVNVERLRKKLGSRTGAYLVLKHFDREYHITCDRWQKLEHNIYAMHLAIRNWINMEKWGIGSLDQLMSGFSRSRASDSANANTNQAVNNNRRKGDIPDCLTIFGLGETATIDDATAIYHRRARALADDEEKLLELNQTMEKIRSYLAPKD